MNKDKNVPSWQMGICVVGFLAWLLLLSNAERINHAGWDELYKFASGYSLGYLIAFSGFVFWELVAGRGKRFLDPHPVFRWFSYIGLFVIILFGGVSLLAQIFGTTGPLYNIGSAIGAVAVGVGLLPALEKYDKGSVG